MLPDHWLLTITYKVIYKTNKNILNYILKYNTCYFTAKEVTFYL